MHPPRVARRSSRSGSTRRGRRTISLSTPRARRGRCRSDVGRAPRVDVGRRHHADGARGRPCERVGGPGRHAGQVPDRARGSRRGDDLLGRRRRAQRPVVARGLQRRRRGRRQGARRRVDPAQGVARPGRTAPAGHGRRAVHRLPHRGPRRQERRVRRRLALERRGGVGREQARGRGPLVAHARGRRGLQPAVAGDHELLEGRVGRQRPRRRRDVPGQLGPLGRSDLERLAELAPRVDRSLDERASGGPGRSRHQRQRGVELHERQRREELRLPRTQRRFARRAGSDVEP